jgi:hypothetical protein
MFEDSTFESAHRIKSKSKYWMMVTFIVNGSILVIMILIPLIYPEALPHNILLLRHRHHPKWCTWSRCSRR